VIENIARLHAEGRPPLAAAAEGVRDVGLAVSLATLTTVVVFLPLIFMAGDPMLRLMFGALGFPLCLALLFSLMVALVFLPVATARILGARPAPAERVAGALQPIAAFPARLASALLLAGRRLGYAALRGAHAVERGLLALLAPARLLVAAVFVGLLAWRLAGYARTSALLRPLAEFGVSPAGPDAGPGLWLPAALVGAGLALFGLRAWRRRPAAAPDAPRATGWRADSVIDLFVESNGRLLAWTMRHRVLACVLAAFAVMSMRFPMANMTMTSFGEDESHARIDVRVDLEDNFTLGEASREMERYEDLLGEHKLELGFDHVSCRFDRRGGRLSLYWDEAQDPAEMSRVRRRMRELMPEIPGHELRYYDEEQIDTKSRAMVAFELRGPDSDVLARLGEEAIARLEKVPGLTGVSSPLEDAPERVHVQLDGDQAWQLGVTADVALQNIAWALRGAPLPRYQEADREIPFYIEYDSEQAAGLDTLRELDVFTIGGAVPLASFARLEFRQGPSSIVRRNGQTTFTLRGRVDDANRQKEVSDAGYAALRELELPRGYSIGDEDLVSTRQQEEMAELMKALGLSIVLVFLLMGILFESVLLPFSVLFTIPFAVMGAIWTLYLTGTVMDSVGWIGIIILVGVVVNNGIVLIDRIHRLRGEGLDRDAAVVEGGRNRVRPILMTAMTTIFGLLPMSLAAPPSEGIDYRALATCVAGGLAVSTFFTLWVVPLAYTLFDDLGGAVRRRTRW
jgi:multidrug efflux pump subunit AcrB